MDTNSKDRFLEKKFNITNEHILEVSRKVENDDYSDFDIAHGYLTNRDNLRNEDVVITFTISEGQAKRIEALSKKNHVSRSEFIRNTLNKELALSE